MNKNFFEEFQNKLAEQLKIACKTGKKFSGIDYFSIIASIDKLMRLR